MAGDRSGSSGRVLFVDDAARELAALVPALGAELPGHEFMVADSAAAGLQLLAEHEVAAVVTTIRLPDSTGVQFLADVQQRDSGIARLILCGETGREEMVSAAKVAHQLLSKPCDAPTMALAVGRVITVQRRLADPRLRKLMGSVDRLPTVPDIYQKIVATVADPNFEMRQIAAIISQDPAASVEVLKLVNSAMFALPRAVVSVAEAVNLLGIPSVSGLVLAGSLFRAEALPAGLDAEKMQRTAVEASAVARAVAVADGWPTHEADQVSLAAMLRDVGMLVLAKGNPDALADIDSSITDPLERAEQELEAFGCTAPASSAYLLGLWGFPQTVVHAVGAQPLVPDEPGSTPTERILSYAYHRVLAGPDVRPPTPMLDPYRGLRWSTAASRALAEPEPAES